jgi:hypothetical protein
LKAATRGRFPASQGALRAATSGHARLLRGAVSDAAHAQPRLFASGLPGENEEDEYLFLVSLDAFHEKNSGHRLNGTGCACPRRSRVSASSRHLRRTHAVKIPTSFGTQLNIPKLYREVCSRGGYDNVRRPLPATRLSALGRPFRCLCRLLHALRTRTHITTRADNQPPLCEPLRR